MKNSSTPTDLSVEFDRLGVTDFFDALDSLGKSFFRVQEVWDRLDSEYQALSKLLLLGASITDKEAESSLLRSVVRALEPLGVLRQQDGLIYLSGYSLERYRGVWFFVDAPDTSATLYFGYDSIGLARRLAPVAGGSALDLCSGTGIQALILAKSGMRATSIDVNPFASEMCKMNARINKVENNMEVLTGNLYDALSENRKFDLITANPPLLPIPQGLPYPFIGDGGADGLDLVIRIVAGAGGRLNKFGTMLIIGMTTMKNGNVLAVEKLSAALQDAELNGLLSIVSCSEVGSDSAWLQGLARTSMAHSPEKFESEEQAVSFAAEGFASIGANQVCTYVLRAWPSRATENALRIQYFSGGSERQDPWRM